MGRNGRRSRVARIVDVRSHEPQGSVILQLSGGSYLRAFLFICLILIHIGIFFFSVLVMVYMIDTYVDNPNPQPEDNRPYVHSIKSYLFASMVLVVTSTLIRLVQCVGRILTLVSLWTPSPCWMGCNVVLRSLTIMLSLLLVVNCAVMVLIIATLRMTLNGHAKIYLAWAIAAGIHSAIVCAVDAVSITNQHILRVRASAEFDDDDIVEPSPRYDSRHGNDILRADLRNHDREHRGVSGGQIFQPRRTRRTPLTPQQVGSYTTLHRYTPVAEASPGTHLTQCMICLADFSATSGTTEDGEPAGEWLRRLPCQHSYHSECASDWLRTKPTCPLCRKHVVLLGRELRRAARAEATRNEDSQARLGNPTIVDGAQSNPSSSSDEPPSQVEMAL